MEGTNQPQSDEVLSVIQEIQKNMHRQDFTKYMKFCMVEWQRQSIELDKIDEIMTSICKQWNISKHDLMGDKTYMRFTKPRAMMYYAIKKYIDLSYDEMSKMFQIRKSYIKKLVDNITFLLNQKPEKVVKNHLTKNEKLMIIARGNPDNKNVIEARRILKMRGIEWDEKEKNMVLVLNCIKSDLATKSLISSLNSDTNTVSKGKR